MPGHVGILARRADFAEHEEGPVVRHLNSHVGFAQIGGGKSRFDPRGQLVGCCVGRADIADQRECHLAGLVHFIKIRQARLVVDDDSQLDRPAPSR